MIHVTVIIVLIGLLCHVTSLGVTDATVVIKAGKNRMNLLNTLRLLRLTFSSVRQRHLI